MREVNQLFGCNMSVRLSRPWQVQLEEIESVPASETSSEPSSEPSSETSGDTSSETSREGE